MELSAAVSDRVATDRGSIRIGTSSPPAAAPDLAVRCAGVGFVYADGTRALRDVDLEVQPGERVAIVGQNGSGKSTLVRQFIGLLRPSEGTVEINGRAVGQRHVAALAREVGLAFQNPDRQIFSSRART